MHGVLIKVLGFSVLLSGAVFAQERFTASTDGQEITDSKTSLIWRRCPEGMSWKVKTCVGEAAFFTQAEATARAAAAGGGWRLPIMRELSSIASIREAEDGKAAINPVAFPGTPKARFWTSSSTGSGYFTYVAFGDGSAGEGPRNSPGALRLVRNKR